VVFRDIQAATQAMRALQGFEFFGMELVSPVFHRENINRADFRLIANTIRKVKVRHDREA
jgi:hypothetical protein